MKTPEADAVTITEGRDMAERQLSHLKRLVDDLLDVSRIMAARSSSAKRRIDLATVIARAVETVRPLVDAEQHELIVATARFARTDRGRRRPHAQVLSNLLSNAVKYTPAPGRIWLRAACEDGQVVVSVRDTGIGIAPEVVPRLFEMFMQVAPGTSQSQGGLGIGLTLVKNLVEMHGGTVEVQVQGSVRGVSSLSGWRQLRPHQKGKSNRHSRAADSGAAAGACSSWMTTSMRRRAWPCCCACTDMRSAWRTMARRRGPPSRWSCPSWSSSTLACRG